MQATDDSAEGSEARFEEYCEEVEKSAAWGGQLELEALSRAYRRHITVYSVGMPPVEMGKEFGGNISANRSQRGLCFVLSPEDCRARVCSHVPAAGVTLHDNRCNTCS